MSLRLFSLSKSLNSLTNKGENFLPCSELCKTVFDRNDYQHYSSADQGSNMHADYCQYGVSCVLPVSVWVSFRFSDFLRPP